MFQYYDIFCEVRNILTIGKSRKDADELHLFADNFESLSVDSSHMQNSDVMYYLFN